MSVCPHCIAVVAAGAASPFAWLYWQQIKTAAAYALSLVTFDRACLMALGATLCLIPIAFN